LPEVERLQTVVDASLPSIRDLMTRIINSQDNLKNSFNFLVIEMPTIRYSRIGRRSENVSFADRSIACYSASSRSANCRKPDTTPRRFADRLPK
jgi:hypothetical protein